MITQKLIAQVQEFIKANGPMLGHQIISDEAGQKIAKALGADCNIVLLGTSLMDCIIGIAIKENRLSDHVQMCYEKSKEILDADNDITGDEKQNVLACVKEHHGADKFYSIESEIVCNSDCYRFASVTGFYFAMTNFKPTPNGDMKKFFYDKVMEKTNMISLDFAKDDLKEQIEIVRNFVSYL